MKTIILGALVALSVTPAQAQTAFAAGAREARPVAVARVRPDVAGPIVRAPRGNSDRQTAAELIRQATQRAHNAVENGARPAQVRQALQDYKQQLRQRLYGN